MDRFALHPIGPGCSVWWWLIEYHEACKKNLRMGLWNTSIHFCSMVSWHHIPRRTVPMGMAWVCLRIKTAWSRKRVLVGLSLQYFLRCSICFDLSNSSAHPKNERPSIGNYLSIWYMGIWHISPLFPVDGRIHSKHPRNLERVAFYLVVWKHNIHWALIQDYSQEWPLQ